LKKLRGKQLVHRIDGTRRYEAVSSGLKTLATVTVLRTHVIKPLLAATQNPAPARGGQNPTTLDRHYETLRPVCTASFTNWASPHDRQFLVHEAPVSALLYPDGRATRAPAAFSAQS
jgi:hypothetical protein